MKDRTYNNFPLDTFLFLWIKANFNLKLENIQRIRTFSKKRFHGGEKAILNNQLQLDQFSSGKHTPVKLGKKERNNLIKKKQKETIEHLEKAIIGISDMTPYRSFTLSDIQFHVQMTLLRLEKKEILFNKVHDGRRRLYKKFSCRFGLKAWRRCPEPSCVAFANGMDYECPYEEPSMSSLWRE